MRISTRALSHSPPSTSSSPGASPAYPSHTGASDANRTPTRLERAHLTSALQANERELDAVLTQRDGLERELGDPSEVRAEREGLEHGITQATREHTALRNELAERELHNPGHG